MTPKFDCIHCGKSVPATVQQRGLRMLCPHCHAEVSIPEERVTMAESPAPVAMTMPRFEVKGSDVLEGRNFLDGWLSPNMRVRDSALQRIFTLFCMLVLGVWGFFFTNRTLEGFLLGIGGGVVVGYSVSGFFLMIYRIFRPD